MKGKRKDDWNRTEMVGDGTWTSLTTALEAEDYWIATLIVHDHTQPQSHPEQWKEMRRRDGLLKSLHCVEREEWWWWSKQRSQIVDCDGWFDMIWKLSVQWFMIINMNSMKQREWGLDIIASSSDEWFKSSSIEWWWDERMSICGLLLS